MIAEQDLLGVFITYQFDPVGNRMLRIDGRKEDAAAAALQIASSSFVGAIWPSTYSYDPLNRKIRASYINGELATYTFDPAGQKIAMRDVSGITSWTYDNNGRVILNYCPSGWSYSVYSFSYDAANNKVLETNQWRQNPVTWTYDPLNQPVGLQQGPIVVTYGYDPLGRAVNRQLDSSAVSTYAYDPAGRLTALAHINLAGAGFAAYTATYDNVGNRLSQQELDGSVTSYTYDKSYQLINEYRTGFEPYNITYVYDPVGNRLNMISSNAVTTYSYNPANGLVLTQPPTGQPTTTSYDPNGNTLLDNAGGALSTYTWDQNNRLLVYAQPSGSLTSTYSDDGKRQYIAQGIGPSRYAAPIDWVGDHLRAVNPVGAWFNYHSMPGQWGVVSANDLYGNPFDLPDTAHNVRQVIYGNTVNCSFTYTAFGVEGFNGAYPYFNHMYRYQGQAELFRDYTNWIYAMNRFLDTVKGRFVSRDPIGFRGRDWNLYRFVGNNPVTRVDPSGLQCSSVAGPIKLVLQKYFQSAWIDYLVDVFECIGEAESSCSTSASAGGNSGMFQLDATRYSACGYGCDQSDLSCQASTAARVLAAVCQANLYITVCDALGASWGVVHGQNQQFWNCVSRTTCKKIKTTRCCDVLKHSGPACSSSVELAAAFRCSSGGQVPQCGK